MMSLYKVQMYITNPNNPPPLPSMLPTVHVVQPSLGGPLKTTKIQTLGIDRPNTQDYWL